MTPAPPRTTRRAIIVTAALASMAWSCAGDDTATRPPTSLPAADTPESSRQERPTTSAIVPDPTEVSTTPASTPPAVGTVAIAPARLVDRPCDVAPVYAADCYWFDVPERRDVADARIIRLWVAVIRHDGPDAAATPRIHLPGGPGFPASTGWVAGTIELDPRDSAHDRRRRRARHRDAANHSSPAPSSTRRSRRPHHTKTVSPTITGWRRPAGTASRPTVSTSTATTPSRAPPTSSNCDKRSASTSSSCAASATAPAWAGRSTARTPPGSPGCSSTAR